MSNFKKYLVSDYSIIVLFSILLLFFIQTLSDLVERIYAYALLNLEPDENIAGLAFLFAPLILLFFWKKIPDIVLLISGELIIVSRLIEPLTTGLWVYIFAGLSVASFLVFFPAMIIRLKNNEHKIGFDMGISLAIAVSLSILFRVANATIDISQYGWYQIIGWVLGIIASLILVGLYLKFSKQPEDELAAKAEDSNSSFWKILGLSMGIFSIFITIWFTFMSPTVITRWTEANYSGIVVGLVITFGVFILLKLWKPDLVNRLKSWMLWVWNGIFAISMTLTVLVHQIFFPDGSAAYPLIAPATAWYHHIPLAIMIITSPIIFLDFTLLTKELIKLKPKPIKIGGSFAIGGLFIVIMIFVQVLPNVWGYLEPISTGFRDQYWLAFFIPGLFVSLSILLVKKSTMSFEKIVKKFSSKVAISSLFGLILIGTVIGSVVTEPRPNHATPTTLVIMTYNVQQGVNASGDRNYDGLLELIRAVDPDILGLQECDPTRIGGGNLDVVRYFASHLNMYSYYGPKTVTNTYGCAILSKFPITNAYSFFTTSDEEQIGSAYAKITVGTVVYNVVVNHPAGGDGIRVTQNNEMLSQVLGLTNVIFMGDFNYRPYSQMYNDTLAFGLIDSYNEFHGTPAIDLVGVDPENDEYNAIDHVFLSSGTTVIDAQYIEKGQSDHPAYWTEIQIP